MVRRGGPAKKRRTRWEQEYERAVEEGLNPIEAGLRANKISQLAGAQKTINGDYERAIRRTPPIDAVVIAFLQQVRARQPNPNLGVQFTSKQASRWLRANFPEIQPQSFFRIMRKLSEDVRSRVTVVLLSRPEGRYRVDRA